MREQGTNTDECYGGHHYYVADVAVVELEGKVVVIALCTACGDVKVIEKFVTSKGKEK